MSVTIEQLAAMAAVRASLRGRDADSAHEDAYAFYTRLATAAGLLEQATTEGLPLLKWGEMERAEMRFLMAAMEPGSGNHGGLRPQNPIIDEVQSFKEAGDGHS